MSKSIYEEALESVQILSCLINLKELNSKKKLDMLTQIEQALEQALEQAQKQEKLLGLYKQLVNGNLQINLSVLEKIKEIENNEK